MALVEWSILKVIMTMVVFEVMLLLLLLLSLCRSHHHHHLLIFNLQNNMWNMTCPSFECFMIISCIHYSTVDFKYLSWRIVFQCSTLMWQLQKISDRSLPLVAENYPKLEFLDLTRYVKLVYIDYIG